jgi:hypothetical protein
MRAMLLIAVLLVGLIAVSGQIPDVYNVSVWTASWTSNTTVWTNFTFCAATSSYKCTSTILVDGSRCGSYFGDLVQPAADSSCYDGSALIDLSAGCTVTNVSTLAVLVEVANAQGQLLMNGTSLGITASSASIIPGGLTSGDNKTPKVFQNAPSKTEIYYLALGAGVGIIVVAAGIAFIKRQTRIMFSSSVKVDLERPLSQPELSLTGTRDMNPPLSPLRE